MKFHVHRLQLVQISSCPVVYSQQAVYYLAGGLWVNSLVFLTGWMLAAQLVNACVKPCCKTWVVQCLLPCQQPVSSQQWTLADCIVDTCRHHTRVPLNHHQSPVQGSCTPEPLPAHYCSRHAQTQVQVDAQIYAQIHVQIVGTVQIHKQIHVQIMDIIHIHVQVHIHYRYMYKSWTSYRYTYRLIDVPCTEHAYTCTTATHS